MKHMLKIEMERALKGAAFKIALIIGMIIVTVQFVKVGDYEKKSVNSNFYDN